MSLVTNNTKVDAQSTVNQFNPTSNVAAVIRKINFFAIATIAITVLANLPGADAGPLSYSACCLACTASLPPAIPACLALCSAVLFFPSP